MIKSEVIGIYGGTFNPPHLGHERALRAFVDAIKPSVTYVIPDNLPPHKEYSGTVTSVDRLKMCEIAFSDIAGVVISDREITRGGRSYTVETLREMTSPGVEIYFLCGTDMLLTMDSWYMAEEIFSLANIACVRREDDDETEERLKQKISEYKEKFGARITLVASDVLEISSTELRNSLKYRRGLEGVINKAVLEFIKSKELYL